MSMTSGGRSIRASASVTTDENSRSASNALVPLCSRMNATVAVSSRMLMVLSTAPSIGTPEARLADRRDVRREDRHAVAGADAAPCQRRGEAAATRIGLGPGEAASAVDDRRVIGIDRGGALDERERGERRVVRRRAVEIRLERVRALLCAHSRYSSSSWSSSSRLPAGARRGAGRPRSVLARAPHAQPVARQSARQPWRFFVSLSVPTRRCRNRRSIHLDVIEADCRVAFQAFVGADDYLARQSSNRVGAPIAVRSRKKDLLASQDDDRPPVVGHPDSILPDLASTGFDHQSPGHAPSAAHPSSSSSRPVVSRYPARYRRAISLASWRSR